MNVQVRPRARRGSYEFFLEVLHGKSKQDLTDFALRMNGQTSDEEIENASVQKWMKKHLMRYRRERFPSQEELVEQAKQAAIRLQYEKQPALGIQKDTEYPVYKYNGMERYVGGILAETGDHFQVTEDIVWWGSHRVPHKSIPFNFNQILGQSELVADMDAKGYRHFLYEMLNQKYTGMLTDDTPDDGSNRQSSSGVGFRIERPGSKVDY